MSPKMLPSIVFPPNRMAVSVHIYEGALRFMHDAGLATRSCNPAAAFVISLKLIKY